MTETYRVIGLMSGTSLDGTDIVYVSFEKTAKQWDYNILNCKTIPYSESWVNKLTFNPQLKARDLLLLDAQLGNYFGNLINQFILDNTISKEEIDLIASHGHTLFHSPENAYTAQIGHGAHIKAKTGITTVCDFRYQDIALSGQGAPLVPIGDELLFSEYDACLNLGGFANISLKTNGKRIAFDICPVNFVLNNLAKTLGKDFDENGEISRKGILNEELLTQLNQLDFYQTTGQKSLGAEWVLEKITPLMERSQISNESKLRTFTEHIAQQINFTLNYYGVKKILISGGGAYNHYLVERLGSLTDKKLFIPNPDVIEFKEALIFALLGTLRIRKEINILGSATGAKHNHSSGIIYH